MIFTIDSVVAILLVMILISTVYVFPAPRGINRQYGEDVIEVYLHTNSTEYIALISNISNICGSMYIDKKTVYFSMCNCSNQVVSKRLFYDKGWHEIEFKYCQ